VRQLLLPARDWGPALVRHRKLVKHVAGFITDPEDWNHGVAFTYHNMDDNPTVTMHGVTVVCLKHQFLSEHLGHVLEKSGSTEMAELLRFHRFITKWKWLVENPNDE